MLDLRPIGTLSAQHAFLVPDYQRGYRWGQRNVLELLQDLLDFAQQPVTERSGLYCLQPIVVQPLDAQDERLPARPKNVQWYELVDGQQRLTTLYLLLAYWRQANPATPDSFQLHYQTRERSSLFLQALPEQPDHPERDANLDFHHMGLAYATIQAFLGQQADQAALLQHTLLEQTAVIWYELAPDAPTQAVFQRLNSGKIRLTNAELIKALFLSQGSGESSTADQLERQHIALEWEQIENQLQDDNFWYFLADRHQSLEQRIEFIFQLAADDINESETNPIDMPRTDPLYSFLTFSRYFERQPDRTRNWQRVKRYVLRFSDWYAHPRLYHYVGFLRTQRLQEVPLNQLVAWWNDSRDKPAFERRLLATIEDLLPSDLERLSYNPHDSTLSRAYLLWFNIVTLLHQPDAKQRFRFAAFKQQFWDIEHIRSVHSELPSTPVAQRHWLRQLWVFLEGEASDVLEAQYQGAVNEAIPTELYQQLQQWLSQPLEQPIDTEIFVDFYNQTVEHFQEAHYSERDTHRVGNLCLLDSSTNRSYRNALFPIKRKAIIQLDSGSQYILPATKHVFLKYYSSNLNNMLQWTTQDMEDYERELQKALDFDTLQQHWYGQ